MRLFDTTFIIDLTNGDAGAVKKAEEADAQPGLKAISTITVHEYLRGVYYLYSHDRELLRLKLDAAERDLSRFEILPYTYEVVKVAAEIDADLIIKGLTISIVDVIIAAMALHYRLTIVTRNIEHFRRVKGLNSEVY